MSSRDTNNRPIIVIRRRKKVAAAHHGGAWKVAYADFVTAMMAFFLLLWLLNTVTTEERQGIADYFDTAGVSAYQGGARSVFGGETITQEGSSDSGGEPAIIHSVTAPTPPGTTDTTESTETTSTGPQAPRSARPPVGWLARSPPDGVRSSAGGHAWRESPLYSAESSPSPPGGTLHGAQSRRRRPRQRCSGGAGGRLTGAELSPAGL